MIYHRGTEARRKREVNRQNAKTAKEQSGSLSVFSLWLCACYASHPLRVHVSVPLSLVKRRL